MHNNLKIDPGCRRQDIPGNPVYVGILGMEEFKDFARLPVVTGDLTGADVTFTIQRRDRLGVDIAKSSRQVQEFRDAVENLHSKAIFENLEVPGGIWQEMVKENQEELAKIGEKEYDDTIIRDSQPSLFAKMVKKYVKQTLTTGRHKEWLEFQQVVAGRKSPQSDQKIKDIYKRCGFNYLAELPARGVLRRAAGCVGIRRESRSREQATVGQSAGWQGLGQMI